MSISDIYAGVEYKICQALETGSLVPEIARWVNISRLNRNSFAGRPPVSGDVPRSEEHTSELQSRLHLVCRLLLEKKKQELVVIDRREVIYRLEDPQAGIAQLLRTPRHRRLREVILATRTLDDAARLLAL